MLALNNGNRTKTARDLGVDPRTIFRHLEKGENGGLEDTALLRTEATKASLPRSLLGPARRAHMALWSEKNDDGA